MFADDTFLALRGFPGVAEVPGVIMKIHMHGGSVVHLAPLQREFGGQQVPN